MRFDKFTIKSQELIQNSQNLATQRNNPQIEPEHLLGSMLVEPEGIVNSMLKKPGFSAGDVAQEIALAIDRLPKVSQTGEVYISARTKNVLDASFSEAAKMKDQYVSIEHILLALTDEKEGDAVNIQIEWLGARLAEKNIELVLDGGAREIIAQKGYDPVYGERPLKRVIQKYIENQLSMEIPKGTIAEVSRVNAKVEGDRIVFKSL
ncbi:MAG: hypothetical protein JSU83_09045 [Deltaproteobacteria bacterium]|nr:MAG: hypothetical protein JSU83_09045 [Deltaproteobacteria bacterium]